MNKFCASTSSQNWVASYSPYMKLIHAAIYSYTE